MKAISEKQPWASLIVHGIKDIENRTWPCPKKYIGKRVLIHASAKPVKMINPNSVFTKAQWDSLSVEFQRKIICVDGIVNSAIIGSIEIIDCVINHPSIWAEKTENYTIGMNPKIHEGITGKKVIYNWVLANPILFPEPIPTKGKLSFWEYPNINSEDDICLCNLVIN
ncbi:ASCH domain-containing protein [Bacteroides sp.]|uniref:ASCH domain-containing protein n=1 Tax=Bacteroides sp. TaxID=29523 RepID=UPI0026254CE0|nr:ASCH domain-containing protein [Bacteroides sp.]MDD3038836.1 ASCH domain-containing protein [Bacteroides sp.]